MYAYVIKIVKIVKIVVLQHVCAFIDCPVTNRLQSPFASIGRPVGDAAQEEVVVLPPAVADGSYVVVVASLVLDAVNTPKQSQHVGFFLLPLTSEVTVTVLSRRFPERFRY